ncbi:MAG: hypothetical protein CMO21_02150 [Thioclava sp.]|nr:hypothetical protein [Thioclava sp.]|tara:strand:- start:800 stop:1120 length:321 start_codon:yes stop_codon:yes gene_type:complete
MIYDTKSISQIELLKPQGTSSAAEPPRAKRKSCRLYDRNFSTACSLHRKLTLPIADNGGNICRKGTGAYFPVIPPGRPAAEVNTQVDAFLDIEKGRPPSASNAHLG